MKDWLSPELLAHMQGSCLTPAWYWILLRRDGTAYGFTTHVEDAAIQATLTGIPEIIGETANTVICLARAGFQATDIQMTDTLAPNNLDVTSLLGPDGMTEESIRAGLWANAQIEIGWFNWADVSQGTNIVLMGTLGDVTFGELTVKAELRPLSEPLEAQMDGVTSENCDCKVFDARCGVDPVPYTVTGVVAGVEGDRAFTDPARTEAAGWWTKGEFKLTSGAAAGLVIEIKQSTSDGRIELVEEVYPGFANGDAYSMTPGCNNLLWGPDGLPTGDCKVKYDNARRFRGFRVPGMIAIQQYGGQSGT